MASEVQEARPVRHKTLAAYYTHVYSVRSYISFLLADLSDLERPDDPPAYSSLLHETLCAFDDPLPMEKVPKEKWYPSHADAADHALRRVGKRTLSRAASSGSGSGSNLGLGAGPGAAGGLSRPTDLLLAGDRNTMPHLPINPHRPLGAGAGAERPVGSPAAVFRQTEWQILRARAGDPAWQALVCRTSIFFPVGNNCFMQLSGRGVHEVYESRAAEARAREEEARGSRKRKRAGKQEHEGRRGKKRRKAVGKAEEGRTSRDEKSNQVGGGQARKTAKAGPSPADVKLARARMYYGQPTREKNGEILLGLPPSHILCWLSSQSSPRFTHWAAAQVLLETVVTTRTAFHARQRVLQDCNSTGSEPLRNVTGSAARLRHMTGAMSELLARHRVLPYGTIIRRCLARRDPTRTQLQPVTHHQVERLVGEVLRGVVSPTLLGSARNVDVLVKHAKRFVRLGQFVQVTLHEVMQGIKVEEVLWLHGGPGGRTGPHEAQKRRQLLAHFVRWLFDGLVVPLLKASNNTFYITETAETKYETVYFSHEDWWTATQPHYEHLKTTLLEPLRADELPLAAQHPLGISAVRLIPKPNGFRPIVNLGRSIKLSRGLGGGAGYTSTTARARSANFKLRNIHLVLTLERDRHRAELGATLFGTNEIFEPIRQLKLELLGRGGNGQLPRLFFVKMDIKAAFDTIKQEKMLQVVDDMLERNHDYLLVIAALLLPPPSKASQSSTRRLFKHRALLDDGTSTGVTEPSRRIAQPLRNAIIIDLARRQRVTKDQIMSLLRRHITDNVWQLGTEYHRQRTGIPQGSKISSLLCSFFYAAMENQHLAWTRQPGSRLLRYIDDFLFITDDYKAARRFATQMNAGFAAYGAEVSKGKTLLSFEYSTGSEVAPIALPSSSSTDGRSPFPYCGFLIDTATLELSMDYPRVLQVHIRQTFALRSTRRRGASFVGWFSRQLENRNHVAYLDTAHNARETVHFNVFINFAMTAMKIPHYFAGMEVHGRLAQLLFESICASVEYTHNAGRARVMHAARKVGLTGSYDVKRSDFLFLAETAVLKVLRRKPGKFKVTTHLLARHLAKANTRETEQRLDAVVERGWAAVKDARY